MKSGAASQKKLSESAVDFPRINENYTGRSALLSLKLSGNFQSTWHKHCPIKMLGDEHLHLLSIHFASNFIYEC